METFKPLSTLSPHGTPLGALRAGLSLATLGGACLAQDVSVMGPTESIQAAIEAVGPDGTVFIQPGTYTETLVIDPTGLWGASRGQDAMTLAATGPGVVLSWPGAVVRGATLDPAIQTSGLEQVDAILAVAGTSAVSLEGLAFDGNDDTLEASPFVSAPPSCGLFASQSGVSITDVEFKRFDRSARAGAQGLGVLVDAGSALAVSGTSFETCASACIDVRQASACSLTNVDLSGFGFDSQFRPHLGLRLGEGSTADVDDCSFDGFWETDAFLTGSSGAVELVDSAGGSRLKDSTFIDCGFALRRTGALGKRASEGAGPVDEFSGCLVTHGEDAPAPIFFEPTAGVQIEGAGGAPWRVEDNAFVDLIGHAVSASTEGGTIAGNNFNFNGRDILNENARDDSAGLNAWTGNRWSDLDSNVLGPSQYLVPGTAGAIDGAPLGELASFELYGLGCPGEGGIVPQISVPGPPVLGTPAYPIQLSQALAETPVALGYSLTQESVPVGGGCFLHLGGSIGIFVIASDASGEADFALPIPPAGLGLEGLSIYFQYFVFDPASAFAGDFSGTQGLRLQLGL